MMILSDKHRRFVLIEQGVIPAAFNLVLNGLICWALFRSVESVPLWGESSVGVDLLVTAFILPFLTCVIISGGVSKQVRSGKVPPLPGEQLSLSGWSQRPSFVRGLFLGVVGVIFAAIPVVWALELGQAQPFSVSSFVTFKAVWAALLALVVAPLIAWWELAAVSREHMV